MAGTDPGSRTKTSLFCVVVSVPFLVLSCFLGVWSLPCLVTFSVLVLSNVLFCTFTKKKVVLDGDELICSSKNLVEVDAPDSEELLSETETVALEQNASNEVEANLIQKEYAFKMPEIEMGSDSDCDSEEVEEEADDDDLIRSQNHGLNWFCTDNNVDEESTETSNDSVSASSDDEEEDDEDEYGDDDDDSLIEIALPGEEPKQKMQSNLPTDLLSETNFRQQGLEELLEEINEMNEEDNLIEIDISKFDLYELNINC